MNRRRGALAAGLLVAFLAAPVPAVRAAPAPHDSLIMVLDSSGSMAQDDGSGSTRMETAKKAVNTVVDTLPDGYPTGLRVYGAGKARGCDDTRLVEEVGPLDRAAMKKAVAGVRPKGDTPIGLSLREAVADLPQDGRRTVLLISDGEDNCGAPPPCEVAEELAGDGVDLRVDTIGFQVRGEAREQLECIAEAGHGYYYDAPDADALARQLERASGITADAYRFEGRRITGGEDPGSAPVLLPGQYLDTIGPGETRSYAADLDAGATADLAVTAVPRPGVKVSYGDGVDLELTTTGEHRFTCDTGRAHFGQDEGAMIVSGAVSRVPGPKGDGYCDKAGRHLLTVTRTSDPDSDRARWPIELRYGEEAPLAAGITPAAAETAYGEKPGPVTGEPRDVNGGTGFNDARTLGTGVWRDALLPAQTRFYKVRLGWGQRLSYTAEFANEPVLDDTSASSYVETAAYAPGRRPVGNGPDYRGDRPYYGEPLSVGLGTVPVTWTNRWVGVGAAPGARVAGEYYITVSLGPEAARLAENARVGVVLRVSVTGQELAGPQHRAPALDGKKAVPADGRTDTAVADVTGAGNGPMAEIIAAGVGGAVALTVVAGVTAVHRTRRGRA